MCDQRGAKRPSGKRSPATYAIFSSRPACRRSIGRPDAIAALFSPMRCAGPTSSALRGHALITRPARTIGGFIMMLAPIAGPRCGRPGLVKSAMGLNERAWRSPYNTTLTGLSARSLAYALLHARPGNPAAVSGSPQSDRVFVRSSSSEGAGQLRNYPDIAVRPSQVRLCKLCIRCLFVL